MATDIFEDCVKFLNDAMDECIGKCGTFVKCSGEETPLTFTLGGTRNSAQDFSSRFITYEVQDIIVNNLDQPAAAGTFREWLGRTGNLFRHNDSFRCDGFVYTVMADELGSMWDYTDPYRCSARVHVKCTGTT